MNKKLCKPVATLNSNKVNAYVGEGCQGSNYKITVVNGRVTRTNFNYCIQTIDVYCGGGSISPMDYINAPTCSQSVNVHCD